MKKRALDAALDNSPAGVRKRAAYAQQSLKHEIDLLSAEIGGFMCLCALLGSCVDQARRAGVSKCEFRVMVIELLYHLDHPDQPIR